MRRLEIIPLNGLPLFEAGDDIAGEIETALAKAGLELETHDVVVVAQKIVSKVEGRQKPLSDFVPDARAIDIAHLVKKDERFVQAVLEESSSVLRAVPHVLITEHRLGHVMANAGIDQSNISGDDEEEILLLPLAPDTSAATLRDRLQAHSGVRVGVVISDSFGRPWRIGTTGIALGTAGPAAVVDRRGDKDLFGRTLVATEIALADMIASAAVLVMGETNEGCPVAILRGLDWDDSGQTSAQGLRDASMDLFR